ncbi:MAG: hypothetical protein A7316_05570 [Candidatus Altiarchaeales archaeon WOR_SM1_86-2]|nr:MAG: hypothetical protein A7315_04205 [Candidatus Altiarchaeales archaeon WOR_SM1_79]ODS39402.1 MAG: hypothetical protein A7316_05570 [Candidatus Altiarchaeales archaeon WOR_SM1_86-2]
MKLIAFSQRDLAGKNIAKILVEKFGFEETNKEFDGYPVYKRGDIQVIGCKEDTIQLDYLNKFACPEICVIASRHKSASGKETLTCHSTGNFGAAEAGGNDRELAIAPAVYLREALLSMQKEKENGGLKEYDVTLEVTHHGPTNLPFPVLFIEVGSSKEQWSDQGACEAVANSIYGILSSGVKEDKVVIGFGGPHYAPNFTKLLSKSFRKSFIKNISVGHIAPKYAVDTIDKNLIKQMISKTTPKPEFAVLDWKGLKWEHRERVIGILNELGFEWKKISDI